MMGNMRCPPEVDSTNTSKLTFLFYLLSLFVVQFSYLAYLHSFEVDPHHDGIMFTAAIASYEGAVPNRDFFAQYGPIAPLLQGLWFNLTEPTLLSLKIFTSLVLALIGCIIFLGLKTVLPPISSALISLLWVITGPWGLPWSSVISTLITLSCMLLIRHAFSTRKELHQVWSLTLVGVLLAIGCFTRIHTILIFAAIFLVIMIKSIYFGSYRWLFYLLIGFSFTFIFIAGILFHLGALNFYIEQCIMWASKYYLGAHWALDISTMSELSWIPLMGVAAILLTHFYSLLARQDRKKLWWIAILIASLLLILVPLSNMERTGFQSLRNPKILIITASEKSQFITSFALLTLFILSILNKLLQVYKLGVKSFTNNSVKNDAVLQSSIGLASLSQLYPFPDSYHIAFIAPILILALAFGNPSIKLDDDSVVALNVVALTLLPALLLKFILLSNIPRTEFEAESLKGMYGSWRTSSALDQTMKMLEKESRGITFACADGIYAGSSGRYLAENRNFVNWGPKVKYESQPSRLFICYASREIINNYQADGWDIAFEVSWPGMSESSVTTFNVLLVRN
jgi:hypothetical protein